MSIKRIEYIILDLISPYIKQNYPLYAEFLILFGKYLDENNYGKILHIDDNFDPYEIFSELLDLYLDEFFTEVFDTNIFNLTDINKSRFIDLSQRINKIKGLPQSFQVLLQSLVDFTYATAGGDVDVDDLGNINIVEPPDYSEIFNYKLITTSTDIDNVESIIESVHPAGIKRTTIIASLDLFTTGSTIDLLYGGTTNFTTYYSDGTTSTLINPPLKNFGSDAVRQISVVIDDPLLVTQFNFNFQPISKISELKSYTSLEGLYLSYTNITEPPDLSNLLVLSTLYLNNTNITEAPDLSANTVLERLYLNNCNITEDSLSACVDQLYVNRVSLGIGNCTIRLENNNGLTADAIAKIDGTGIYAGDGLNDSGCLVTY